ncbi:hypothetical protein BH18THE1_BH18THE1_03530 [soil metagenome]
MVAIIQSFDYTIKQKRINSLLLLLTTIALLLLFCSSIQFIRGTVQNNDEQNTQKFNFVAAGDFGCGDETNKTIEGMIKKNPKFVIALGDLSYDKSATCWLNSIIPLDSAGRIKITFGDHDLTKKMFKYNDYLAHFNMTKPFYSFNYANVHFLAMATAKNSIIPYVNGSEQYNFVRQDLNNAHNNKSIDWIIVYSFRPFYSSATSHSGQEVLPNTYHPLFDMYGVDIVLQAHSHNYQRTFPLIYNGNSFSSLYNPIIVDKNRTQYEGSNGSIFLTAGTAGAELHNFTGKYPYIVEQFASHGFLNVDINSSEDELKLSGTFYENDGMQKKDHFSISKNKNPPD